MIEKLFKDVCDRIADTVPDYKWIDLNIGQLNMPEESYPMPFPVCLVNISNADYVTEGYGNQQGVVSLVVTIGMDIYEDFHIADGLEAPQRDMAFDALSLIKKTHAALHGWEGDYFSPLTRVTLQSEDRADGYLVFQMIYLTTAKDDSAAKILSYSSGNQVVIRKTE